MSTPPASGPAVAAAAPSAAEPDLLYDATAEELRSSVRTLLDSRSDWQAVLARMESDAPVDTDLWRRLADIGVAGLAVPEELDGSGATWREVAVVAEEIGRATAPVPFLGSTVLATAALLAVAGTGDAPDAAGALLRRLAAGEVATVAVPLSTAPGGAFPAGVTVTGGRASGTVTSVADARAAAVLLVPVFEDGAPALYAVPAAATTRTPVVSLDLTRPLDDVALSDVATGAPQDANGAQLLARGAAAVEAVNGALVAGACILASEQLGVAERCLELTTAYVRERHQFGRPIGSYQALKHRLADLWVSVTQARAVARYAAACLADSSPDLPVAAALAQAHLSELAVHAAEECVQLHGGIGFTWEHPAHLLLKRAMADALSFGTATQSRAALGRLVDLPA
ncbi:MAG: acyl-CoA dehydrogenase [Mycobacterium sp.]|nr:acyl-CoA dehydrogenase [Mycobacterium sp.]